MVEVFKTNIANDDQAKMVLEQMRKTFPGYEMNFDLEDCDKILRVNCTLGIVQCYLLMDLIQSFGFEIEILPDEIIPLRPKLSANLFTEHPKSSEIQETLSQNR